MAITERLLNLAADHTATVTASAASFGTTLSLAAGAVTPPPGLPQWLPYLGTIVGPVLVWLVHKAIGAWAVRTRSLAAAKRKRAAALLADANPANDAEAKTLEDEADADDATADALDSVGKR